MIKQKLDKIKAWSKQLKSTVFCLYIAMRDPRTPAYARYFALFVIGYALSPIDLIPDFIPVLGLLDDLLLIPLGLAILRKMIPPVVMATAERQVDSLIRSGLPASRNAALVIVTIWALVVTGSLWWIANRLLHSGSDNSSDNAPTHYRQQPTDKESPTVNDSDRSRSRDR